MVNLFRQFHYGRTYLSGKTKPAWYWPHLRHQLPHGADLVKKARSLSPFKDSIEAALPDDILKADELYTYIQVKTAETRVWIVLCRRSRQILSFFITDSSMQSCKRLWRKLPYEYLRCGSFYSNSETQCHGGGNDPGAMPYACI